MKIEKVNDNQIRCTLTKEDLASRELKLSELAYGTEKAKTLFRDMMQQANFEFGFEAEDIPLMIEAIPLNAECIVLIITKVEDPEELDTRFSRFAPSSEEDTSDEEDSLSSPSEDVMNLFRRLQKDKEDLTASSNDTQPVKNSVARIFRFGSLSKVMDAAAKVAPSYNGASTLYKDSNQEEYLLLLTAPKQENEAFDKACNVLSEYGSVQSFASTSQAYLEEHYDPLIASNAITMLATQ